MDIYRRKALWKWLLFFSGSIIVFASLWYTDLLVKKIAADERKKVSIWANAIEQKAHLVNYTNEFFKKIETEERKRVEIWAEATKRLINAGVNEDLSFYSQIIAGNNTIPVVLTDENLVINAVKNVDFSTDTVEKLQGKLLEEFSVNTPIKVNYGPISNYLYFKESKVFTELRSVLNDLTQSFFSEVVVNSASVPVIVSNESGDSIFAFGNIDSLVFVNSESREELINEMKTQNNPIVINFEGQGVKYIYYKDSYLLTQLRYYPIIQFLVIGAFLLIAYVLFSIARRSEQNKVWVGMAKETAHQLGTPISSMMAWADMLPETNSSNEIVSEIRKDIQRLERVAERFSKIGSKPELSQSNLITVLYESLDYIKARAPRKILFSMAIPRDSQVFAYFNSNLLAWVIENLCTNAVDAMEGEGKLSMNILEQETMVIIDVSDTGKGIPKRRFKRVFSPGFTTKKRGWGLGLSLSKRIIEEYHHGKIFVKQSVPGKETTFRIVLYNK